MELAHSARFLSGGKSRGAEKNQLQRFQAHSWKPTEGPKQAIWKHARDLCPQSNQIS